VWGKKTARLTCFERVRVKLERMVQSRSRDQPHAFCSADVFPCVASSYRTHAPCSCPGSCVTWEKKRCVLCIVWANASRPSACGSPQREFGEVGGVLSPIPREQSVGLHQGMCSDDEVSDHVLSRLDTRSALVAVEVLLRTAPRTDQRRASADVLDPGSARSVQRVGLARIEAKAGVGQEAVEGPLLGEVGGQPGVDRVADDDGARAQRLGQGTLRGIAVGRVGDQHVEQNVGVDGEAYRARIWSRSSSGSHPASGFR